MTNTLPDSKSILAYYERRLRGHGRGGWATVGHVLGVSIGAAYEIAHGHRPLSERQALVWAWWVEHEEQMPELRDAIVCPTCGQLHQAADCHGLQGEVRIVPAGARILRPPSHPPRLQDMTRSALALAIRNRIEL